MTLRSLLAALAVLASLAVSAPSGLLAQANGPGPVSLVLSYKASLQDRAAFRKTVETVVAPRFKAWKDAHIMASVQLLFTAAADTSGSDLTVILDFDRFSDLGGWLDIERTLPGGLPPEALRYVTAITSQVADGVAQGSGPQAKPESGVFMVIPYTVTVDAGKYRRYVKEYTTPQMDAWVRSGVMASYRIFMNENPAEAPWGALLVLEYKGLDGLAQRETLKAKVRAQLASNPAWKAWSDDKTGVRTELHPLIAVPIVAP